MIKLTVTFHVVYHVGQIMIHHNHIFYASLHEECPKHYGHTGDPGVTPGTCGAIGERAQMILVWVRAADVGNVSIHED